MHASAKVKRSSAFLLLLVLFSMLLCSLHTDTMQHWWWLEKALLAVTCWYQHWHTHIYSVRVDIFSPGVLLHTVGYKHPCATFIKYDHWMISAMEVTILLKLSSGCYTPLFHLLPHSPLFSAVLCSIEIAPIQSCALHVLVLLRGLKPFFFLSDVFALRSFYLWINCKCTLGPSSIQHIGCYVGLKCYKTGQIHVFDYTEFA